jgi:hypothetical protein
MTLTKRKMKEETQRMEKKKSRDVEETRKKKKILENEISMALRTHCKEQVRSSELITRRRLIYNGIISEIKIFQEKCSNASSTILIRRPHAFSWGRH